MIDASDSWLCETLVNGGFWRDMVATLVGALVGVGLPEWFGRKAERKRRAAERDAESKAIEAKRATNRRVLVEGLMHTEQVLVRMQQIMERGQGLPSQRPYTAHLDASIVTWAESHETPEVYRAIVDLAHALDHVNRRLDFVGMNEAFERLSERLLGKREPVAPYLSELHRQLQQVDGMLMLLFKLIATQDDLATLDAAITRLQTGGSEPT